MTIRALIFSDPSFTHPPACGPDEVVAALGTIPLVDDAGLERLDRSAVDVLIFPYIKGHFSPKALAGMMRFHSQGGGLLFLGDTPHVGDWYPFRNSQAPSLGLTRATDDFHWLRLTDAGREVWGDLPGMDRFTGRPMRGVRTTAFPPDEARILIEGGGHFKRVGPVVMVERKRPDWLGARMIVAGWDGSEPRENVLGVCALPHQPDFGMLDATWEGFVPFLQGMVRAVCPPALACALECTPCARTGELALGVARLRNLSGRPVESVELRVMDVDEETCLLHETIGSLAPGVTWRRDGIRFLPRLGPNRLRMEARASDTLSVDCDTVQWGFTPWADSSRGFGFSTYWSFRDGEITTPFRAFVASMAGTGAQYVRFAVNWEDVQPTPGAYNWQVVDQMVVEAHAVGLAAYLWVFPTARGSGLGEAGIPAWVIKEPAIDRHGKPGNFPCIWSPFYRQHYFAFLTALTQRYAHDDRVERFVYDFGNSDFAYCYHYYGGPGDEFDYSPHEQSAFVQWLQSDSGLSLPQVSQRWGATFAAWQEVPVPFAEQRDAWLVYDRFRTWGVHQGIRQSCDIIRDLAPDKVPPDLPGHGLGSIADLLTHVYDAKRRHIDEEAKQPYDRVSLHNTGREWGGEAWQVGGSYPDYDDALFQSVRLGADYLTIPGPDLGLAEADIARVGMIRRTLQGFSRETPEVAVIDGMAWHQLHSLAHVATRLDQSVDLLNDRCWFDFSGYRLLVLPPNEAYRDHRGPQSLLPTDPAYAAHLRACVENGLWLMLFPDTGVSLPGDAMRRALGVSADDFGSSVDGDEVLWREANGTRPMLVKRPLGKGGLVLANHDASDRGPDAGFDPYHSPDMAGHTLTRVLDALGISPQRIRTGQANVMKQWLHCGAREAVILYNARETPAAFPLSIRLNRAADSLLDLASGQRLILSKPDADGWQHTHLDQPPKTGWYGVAIHHA